MTKRPKIVFLDRETLSPETRLRAPDFPHELVVYDRTAPNDIATRIVDADIVITNKVPLRADVLEKAQGLKLIAVSATGTDIIDLDAARARGIAVANIRGYAKNTVPEHTFALILALRRSLVAYRNSVIEGRWQEAGQFCYFDFPIADLAGSTLGIVGSGSLGSAVGQIGKALGMNVVYSGRKDGTIKPGQVPFAQMLGTSDVITLHCPLTPETRNLIGASEFVQMSKKPILINTARGGLVDEEALERALELGQVAGAGIDVTAPEPPPSDSTVMRIASRENVIVTPHTGWASREAIQALADQLIGNIEAFWAGKPRNLVV
ncbi:D-2-hydroxyacid dehydrogenase [Pelagibacterium xiamenense]|uniref:D-2-hydroxyacid dehydrogenase n=1 Tax=Pelagibacterium xiamenense TaxID=2901140 RepID=UPI001E3B9E0E|nr:D-2-hydroxyacid dehydrogenase [Pelagibacterium xiamenense]MCD7058686.1 D-2-hydroxyacid dehydrogenase [Pelagibacterium xiamenense]